MEKKSYKCKQCTYASVCEGRGREIEQMQSMRIHISWGSHFEETFKNPQLIFIEFIHDEGDDNDDEK